MIRKVQNRPRLLAFSTIFVDLLKRIPAKFIEFVSETGLGLGPRSKERSAGQCLMLIKNPS